MNASITPKLDRIRNLVLSATIASPIFFQTVLAETWSLVSSGTYNDIVGVTWDGNRFIAVDAEGGVMQSTNGRTWTLQEVGGDFSAIVAGGGQWLALENSGSYYRKSSNSLIWEARSIGTDSWLRGGLFHNGTFFVIGEDGLIAKSANGINWSNITAGVSDSNLNSLIYGGGLYVVAGDDGIFTSKDCIHWNIGASNPLFNFLDVAYYGGRFVAVTLSFSVVYTSTNGTSWNYNEIESFKDVLIPASGNAVIGGALGFKIVCDNGKAFSTVDAKTFQKIDMKTTSNFNDVAYGNGIYVAVGDNGLVRILDSANAKPEIVVQQPKGSGLDDGSAKKMFGSVKIGKKSATKTFTIKNTGTAKLSGLIVKKSGNSPKDFVVSQPKKSSLVPGGATTFTVAFRPGAKGAKSATLRILNNDSDENPFDIRLAGVGSK